MSEHLSHEAMFQALRQLALALEKLLNPICEVVIHDLRDIEHSIVFVAGNVTNRSVGGSPTDLLLARIGSNRSEEDLYSYTTSLPGGRVMKSSTIFLRDPSGDAYGAFCVNLDISPFLRFGETLSSLVATAEKGDVTELLEDDFQETLKAIVSETMYDMNRGTSLMSRDDKVKLIATLDSRGVFRVRKAVDILSDLLGISRATVYNYLRESREARHENGS